MRLLAYLLAALLALSIVGSAPAGADPNGNQLTSWSALCTGKTEGVFSWSGAQPANCTNLPNRIIAWPDFTANVTHSGTGCGTGNPLPTWSALLTCRGAGTTAVSQNFSGTGITKAANENSSPPPNYFCTTTGGATTLTITTPSNTVAPTSLATELSWTPTSIAAYAGSTGTGITLTLTGPNSLQYVNQPVSNGSAVAVTSWAAGMPAGSYTWTMSGLGTQICNTTSGLVSSGSEEQVSGSITYYQ